MPYVYVSILNITAESLRSIGQTEGNLNNLLEAIKAYRNVLAIWQKDKSPYAWARTQYNIGQTLLSASLLETEGATSRRSDAIEAFHQALEVLRCDQSLDECYSLNQNLGVAYFQAGKDNSEDVGTGNLNQAVAAYKEALRSISLEKNPDAWAETQRDLGSALASIGMREPVVYHLEDAVNSFNQALKVYTLEHNPDERASTLSDLGHTLLLIGERGQTNRLTEAVSALREALNGTSENRNSRSFGYLQLNLGSALLDIGAMETGTSNLTEALTALRLAQKQLSIEVNPTRFESAHVSLQIQECINRAKALLKERGANPE